MTDSSPLVRIKQALNKLKAEVVQMDMRMGVVSQDIKCLEELCLMSLLLWSCATNKLSDNLPPLFFLLQIQHILLSASLRDKATMVQDMLAVPSLDDA